MFQTSRKLYIIKLINMSYIDINLELTFFLLFILMYLYGII